MEINAWKTAFDRIPLELVEIDVLFSESLQNINTFGKKFKLPNVKEREQPCICTPT